MSVVTLATDSDKEDWQSTSAKNKQLKIFITMSRGATNVIMKKMCGLLANYVGTRNTPAVIVSQQNDG